MISAVASFNPLPLFNANGSIEGKLFPIFFHKENWPENVATKQLLS